MKLALEEWKHWLEGATHQFQVITDHYRMHIILIHAKSGGPYSLLTSTGLTVQGMRILKQMHVLIFTLQTYLKNFLKPFSLQLS